MSIIQKLFAKKEAGACCGVKIEEVKTPKNSCCSVKIEERTQDNSAGKAPRS
jgi:hypothetical protein